jgi:glucosamine-6-phosphate deaminase
MSLFETPSFQYAPSRHVPFRDKAVLDRMRAIGPAEFRNPSNPNLSIQILKGAEIEFRFITDLFFRIQQAMSEGRKLVLILPQPWPLYERVAWMINRARVNCRTLYTFNMDEYADENGRVAPESWPFGFTHALKKFFYSKIDPDLRPPENQMIGLTQENLGDYGRRISDLGGADLCYMGPGWTGHVAFVEPDAPEVPRDLEAFKKLGPGLVTLSPFTIAQNSLHGCFGAAGDLAAVPPRAATIGPAQVLEAKHRISTYAIGVRGTTTSWQKLVARLCLFGPVTPLVPDSIVQLKPSEIWVSDSIASPIETDWEIGY